MIKPCEQESKMVKEVKEQVYTFLRSTQNSSNSYETSTIAVEKFFAVLHFVSNTRNLLQKRISIQAMLPDLNFNFNHVVQF